MLTRCKKLLAASTREQGERDCRETSQLASYERFQSDRRHYLSPGCVSRQPDRLQRHGHGNAVRYNRYQRVASRPISADLLPHTLLNSPSLSPTKRRRGKVYRSRKKLIVYHLVHCTAKRQQQQQQQQCSVAILNVRRVRGLSM